MHGLPVGGWTGGWGAAVRGASNYAVYDRTGGPVKSEEVPLDLDPPTTLADGLAAMRHLQEVVLNATRTEGIVLSYGGLYGPGTNMTSGGELFEMIRRRRFH